MDNFNGGPGLPGKEYFTNLTKSLEKKRKELEKAATERRAQAQMVQRQEAKKARAEIKAEAERQLQAVKKVRAELKAEAKRQRQDAKKEAAKRQRQEAKRQVAAERKAYAERLRQHAQNALNDLLRASSGNKRSAPQDSDHGQRAKIQNRDGSGANYSDSVDESFPDVSIESIDSTDSIDSIDSMGENLQALFDKIAKFCCFFKSIRSIFTYNGSNELQVIRGHTVWCEGAAVTSTEFTSSSSTRQCRYRCQYRGAGEFQLITNENFAWVIMDGMLVTVQPRNGTGRDDVRVSLNGDWLEIELPY